MNIAKSKWCLVLNCKRPAYTLWTPDMAGKPAVPVCLKHSKLRLWWYKGWIFCRDEEAE